MSILNSPKFKVLDKKGEPIVGAKMYIYTAGTDDKAFFFSDSILATPLTNPVLTDEYGDFPVCYTENKNYKIIIKDNKDNLLYTLDDINFFSTLESIVKQTEDGSISIVNSNYERDIVFNISNYDNPDGIDALKVDSTTCEIKVTDGYEDIVSDNNTLITKGYVEKYPTIPLDYIARLPITFTDSTLTIGSGVCKSSDGESDIRVENSFTQSFNEETVYKFTSGEGTITFPSQTTARLLLVGGGGAGGYADVEERTSPLSKSTNARSGGGGAGGVIEKTSYIFPADTYNITVGAGGAISSTSNNNGGDSSVGSLIAYGGGAGGILTSSSKTDIGRINGSSGGCGGGAGNYFGATVVSRGTVGSAIDSEQGKAGSGTSGGFNRIESDITNSLVTYSNITTSSLVYNNTGNGGRGALCVNGNVTSAPVAGSSGVVIIRTAKNDNIATTGVVSATTVTPLTPSSTKYVFVTNVPSLVLSEYQNGSDLSTLGYNAFRRLGSITTDSNGHISTFTRNVDNLPWS